MKRLLALGLVIFMTLSLNAQNNPSQLYLLFEFMQVKGENVSDYQQVEEFWSGIHKQAGCRQINSWLGPLVSDPLRNKTRISISDGYPVSSLENMLKAINSLDVYGYAKKAYPTKTDKELNAMFDKTGKSRDMANQVLFKMVDQVTSDFDMKVGTIATLDIMKQLDDSYEKVESEIFKPWHKQMVDQGKKGNWGLLRAILPAGSEVYGTHITFSMYKDEAQLAAFMEDSGGTMDLMTQLAVKEGLKTREWKEVKMAKLIMTVK